MNLSIIFTYKLHLFTEDYIKQLLMRRVLLLPHNKKIMTVAVISTGGTIASTEDTGGDAKPELTGSDLIASIPTLSEDADLTTREFSNVPSAHFSIEDMAELARLIDKYDSNDEITGVVVTQGTDVLEETAYFVDLYYGGETPVVFTGAMRNPSIASPDGPANLLTAITTAEDPVARDRGVLVAFNDQVHAAREVTKTHSMRLDTFRSPEFGPLATRDESVIRWQSQIDRTPTPTKNVETFPNDIGTLFVTADMPSWQVPEPSQCEGVVLATTGAGHIPPRLVDPLSQLVDSNVPVVATTRCPTGRLATSTYDFEGSEATLQDIGCYYSDRNPQKARIETIIAIASGSFDKILTNPRN